MMSDLIYDEVPGPTHVEATACFSPDRAYRYRLTRTWNPTMRRCLFVMLNPSTADAFVVDPTIWRCIAFAKREGCGSLDVVNLFALRSPDPSVLYQHPDPVGPDNEHQIAYAIHGANLIICGWGAHASKLAETVANPEPWVRECAEAEHKPLWCLGFTADGSPKHPLARGKSRIADDQPLTFYPRSHP